jgi:uncharacterized membrane-anchored protein YhcB (DUF1043 family)
MAGPEEAEKPPGRRPPDQIRLYVFCEKARDLVKTIRTDYQTAREWLAKSAVNRIREDPESE